MFQWRPNPNYLVGGGNFISFTRPLHEILPDYYLTFLNQNRIAFGTGNWAFNGKLRLIIGSVKKFEKSRHILHTPKCF